MILIVGAFVLLAVAIALAVWRTRDAAQVTRTGIAGRIPSGPWLLVVGIASPEPEPTPAP